MGEHGFDFDVVILGGGSAGYAAARTLAAGGLRLAVVEGGREVGGLCILRGCMPTKALLHAAELRQSIRAAAEWGITTGEVRVDVPRLMARKDELIAEFARYRRQQLETGPWEFIRSRARFVSPHEWILEGPEGSGAGSGSTPARRRISAWHGVIATGSVLADPPVPGLSEAGYLCSDTAMTLTAIPESLVVLGGGAVALEFAQFFSRMGSRVTLLQRGPHVLREADPDVARELETALRAEGVTVSTGVRITGIEAGRSGKTVRFSCDGTAGQVTAAELFHGLGRRPAVDCLGLDAAGVRCDDRGRILTDAGQRTSVPTLFAAGDCCGPHDIVHLAIQQGEIAARNILGGAAVRDDRLLMSVVFTDPAVATVGHSEATARAAGLDVAVARYPFNDHGRSMILGSQHGFVKLLSDRATGEILGASCVGPHGGELIHEVAAAMVRRMTVRELAQMPHYHPTLAEIWTYPAEELQ